MKKKLLMPPIWIVIVLLLNGCVSTKKTMSSWVGHSYSELIRTWGEPTYIKSDGQGGKVFVYGDETGEYTYPAYFYTTTNVYPNYDNNSFTSYSTTHEVPSQTYTYQNTDCRTFSINKDGIIYSWTAYMVDGKKVALYVVLTGGLILLLWIAASN